MGERSCKFPVVLTYKLSAEVKDLALWQRIREVCGADAQGPLWGPAPSDIPSAQCSEPTAEQWISGRRAGCPRTRHGPSPMNSASALSTLPFLLRPLLPPRGSSLSKSHKFFSTCLSRPVGCSPANNSPQSTN